jgi:hypothetical protein
METERGDSLAPTRARLILATIIVILTVAAVWKFIDYRMQPPPPPDRQIQPARP